MRRSRNGESSHSRLVGVLVVIDLALSVLLKATTLGGKLGPWLQWILLLVAAGLCVHLFVQRKPAKTAQVLIPAYSRNQRILGVVALVLVTLATFGPRTYRYVQAHRPPGRLIVLVAEFDGPDREKYQFRQRFINKLNSALGQYRNDVEVRKLDSLIQEGSPKHDILAIGMAHKAAILIWGWYAATVQNAQVSVHFELLRPPRIAPPLSLDLQGEARTFSIAELNSFTLQEDLSGKLAFACLFTVGLARYSTGDYPSAMGALSQALAESSSVSPSDAAILLYYLGHLSELQGEPDRALAYYSAGIRFKPDFAEILNNRGNLYEAKREHDKAIADYNEAIRLRPDFADAFHNRGFAYHFKGDTDKAIADLTEAIRLKPDFPYAHSNRGNAYRAKGDLDKAISDHTEAIRLKSDDAVLFYNRANAYSGSYDHDRAIADYSEAIRLVPSYANAWCNRGNEYYTTQDFDKAIADASEAIRLRPDLADAFYNRGLAHNARCEYHEAIADFSEYIRLKPDDADAYVSRAYAYIQTGDTLAANAGIREVVRLRPELAKTLLRHDSALIQIIVPRTR